MSVHKRPATVILVINKEHENSVSAQQHLQSPAAQPRRAYFNKLLEVPQSSYRH